MSPQPLKPHTPLPRMNSHATLTNQKLPVLRNKLTNRCQTSSVRHVAPSVLEESSAVEQRCAEADRFFHAFLELSEPGPWWIGCLLEDVVLPEGEYGNEVRSATSHIDISEESTIGQMIGRRVSQGRMATRIKVSKTIHPF